MISELYDLLRDNLDDVLGGVLCVGLLIAYYLSDDLDQPQRRR